MSTRIITIVIEVEQPEANWIWNLHIDGKPIHGIKAVNFIGTGDQTATIKEQSER